jgi:uncharacterized membrane protein YccC
MNDQDETPFDSVEGAHEYLRLLAESVRDASNEVATDIKAAEDPKLERRREALRLAFLKLEQLERHVKASRRLLNDLRTLRRLLLGERAGTARPRGE